MRNMDNHKKLERVSRLTIFLATNERFHACIVNKKIKLFYITCGIYDESSKNQTITKHH